VAAAAPLPPLSGRAPPPPLHRSQHPPCKWHGCTAPSPPALAQPLPPLPPFGGRRGTHTGSRRHGSRRACHACASSPAPNGPARRLNPPPPYPPLPQLESSGTASWVHFLPLGGGTNLTAFHRETKQRRSFNLGSGDVVVQPLATAAAYTQLCKVGSAARLGWEALALRPRGGGPAGGGAAAASLARAGSGGSSAGQPARLRCWLGTAARPCQPAGCPPPPALSAAGPPPLTRTGLPAAASCLLPPPAASTSISQALGPPARALPPLPTHPPAHSQLHTEWTGDCERSRVLLPPDVYLQAGITLVLHTRDGPVPQLVGGPAPASRACLPAQLPPPAVAPPSWRCPVRPAPLSCWRRLPLRRGAGALPAGGDPRAVVPRVHQPQGRAERAAGAQGGGRHPFARRAGRGRGTGEGLLARRRGKPLAVYSALVRGLWSGGCWCGFGGREAGWPAPSSAGRHRVWAVWLASLSAAAAPPPAASWEPVLTAATWTCPAAALHQRLVPFGAAQRVLPGEAGPAVRRPGPHAR
jgi:hypothetical protein